MNRHVIGAGKPLIELRRCLTLVVVVALGGCLSTPTAGTAKPGARQVDPHSEIERLSRQIELWSSGRAEPGEDLAVEPDAATESVDSGDPDVEMGTTGDAPAQPRSEPVRLSEPLVCPDGGEPATAVCSDVCTLAESICANAERICRIASELHGDDWARGKCQDAEHSCREATARCCDCAR